MIISCTVVTVLIITSSCFVLRWCLITCCFIVTLVVITSCSILTWCPRHLLLLVMLFLCSRFLIRCVDMS